MRHVLADVIQVNQIESGRHQQRRHQQAGEIAGDLFIDCTGFAALLLGKTLGVAFKDCSDVLFCDTALAVQVPYDTPDAPMASHTISTAQAAGWIWDIGLPHRRGIGYVYSTPPYERGGGARDADALPGTAARESHAAQDPDPLRPPQTFWKNNCVAVGLAAGFLEPLESSAIVLIEIVGQTDRGADARQPRGHGHRGGALQ